MCVYDVKAALVTDDFPQVPIPQRQSSTYPSALVAGRQHVNQHTQSSKPILYVKLSRHDGAHRLAPVTLPLRLRSALELRAESMLIRKELLLLLRR